MGTNAPRPPVQQNQLVTGVTDGAIIKFGCASGMPCSGCRINVFGEDSENVQEDISGQEFTVKLSPNPFSNEISVLLMGSSSEKFKLEIADTKGTVIQAYPDVVVNKEIIIGSELTSGIYILRLVSSTEVKTFKLIKTQ